MNQLNAALPQGEAQTIPANVRRKKQQGKGSRGKAQDRFRERTGDQVNASLRANLRLKYGLDDESKSVMNFAERAAVVVTNTARELPVTTRGAGFNAVMAYQALERTLGFEKVNGTCSIHQFYRVVMYDIQRKLVLAHRA